MKVERKKMRFAHSNYSVESILATPISGWLSKIPFAYAQHVRITRTSGVE